MPTQPVRLYVETNFIMGMVKGQDAYAASLLKTPRARLTIALPQICLMEAQVAFDEELQRRLDFSRQLKQHRDQMQRDKTSTHAPFTVASLHQASLDYDESLNDFRTQPGVVWSALCARCHLLQTPPATALAAVSTPVVLPRRDHLIWTTMLAHAGRHTASERIVLTNDRQWQPVVEAAGLRYFARTDAFLGWFNSQ